jgi:TetR/AcrR family transcriptional regulator
MLMKTRKSKRNGASSAERTKALVLKAAIDEFAEHGLAGGRVDRIAVRAGVNKQALYYHYGDKEKLFQASLAFGYSASFEFEQIDWQKDPRPAPELMAHIVGRFFDMVAENRNHVALINDENRSKGRHLTAKVLPEIRKATRPTIEAISQVLERGQRSGDFSKAIDPLTLYLMIVGQPIFYFNHCYTLSGILQHNILSSTKVTVHRKNVVQFILAAIQK